MTKIVILDQNQIVPNDYQQLWVHFDWFLSLKYAKIVLFGLKPYFYKIFLWYFPLQELIAQKPYRSRVNEICLHYEIKI